MKYTIIFGGKAGQGSNLLSDIIAEGLISKGFYVFYSRDYQSLIRGGHNFNTLTFSDFPIYSNESKADILICLDEHTEKIHKRDLKKKAIILKNNSNNMFFAGSMYKILGIPFQVLEENIKNLRNYGENMRESRKGHETEKRKINLPEMQKRTNGKFMNGSQAMARASIQSDLGLYYAYPMTPATPLMMELGTLQLDKNNKHKVIELENEIAVIIAGLGSSLTGTRTMVGTSGGGFDLMTEGISMAGMAEIPIVIYLSSRPGPGTGVATYTAQSDLNLALHAGHGEFSRIVIAPGDPLETEEATNQAFYLSQKFRTPVIILGDKHLSESKYIVEHSPKFLEIKNSITVPERFNSYESDISKDKIATEDSKVIKKNFERRIEKQRKIEEETNNFQTYKTYGKKDSKTIVLSFGSTKGAILDSINNLEKEEKSDIEFVQILYLEPFPEKIKDKLEKAKKIIVIENNSTSQLSRLIAEKTLIQISEENRILKYDGRPFFSDELTEEIKKRLKQK